MDAPGPGIYQPRQPRESPLYRLVEDHFDTLTRVHEEQFQGRFGRLGAPPGAPSRSSSTAASSTRDKSSQTTHDFLDSGQQVTVTRRHHPLCGLRLEAWHASKTTVVIVLPDSSRMKLPREWTDIDGSALLSSRDTNAYFTVGGLRERIQLFDRLQGR